MPSVETMPLFLRNSHCAVWAAAFGPFGHTFFSSTFFALLWRAQLRQQVSQGLLPLVSPGAAGRSQFLQRSFFSADPSTLFRVGKSSLASIPNGQKINQNSSSEVK